MCIPIFYAQVIGLWLLLVAIAMLIHAPRFKKTVVESLTNDVFMSFSGFIFLALGLLIVISHNIWVAAWPILITLFGWVLVFQGLMRIFWPHVFARWMKDLTTHKRGFSVMSWVWLVLGIILVWAGFFS